MSTWSLAPDRDGEPQTACEVEVDRLAPEGWVSPTRRSGRGARLIGDEVRYGGDTLASPSDYRRRLRVWPAQSRVEGNCEGQAGKRSTPA